MRMASLIIPERSGQGKCFAAIGLAGRRARHAKAAANPLQIRASRQLSQVFFAPINYGEALAPDNVGSHRSCE
jgi:hypothetical protein